MKLKKLGAFAATGAMALALALTGCGSSNATSGSDAGSSSSDDAKVEKVDGSKEYALVKDGTLTVGTSSCQPAIKTTHLSAARDVPATIRRGDGLEPRHV